MATRLTTAKQGEVAELAFAHRCAARGYVVSKPLGSSSPYDLIVDSGTCLSRVQVRSVWGGSKGSYHVSCLGRARRPLTGADIEILAAYIVSHDAWYIIPVGAFAPATGISLRPGRGGRFECYRDAWHLLR